MNIRKRPLQVLKDTPTCTDRKLAKLIVAPQSPRTSTANSSNRITSHECTQRIGASRQNGKREKSESINFYLSIRKKEKDLRSAISLSNTTTIHGANQLDLPMLISAPLIYFMYWMKGLRWSTGQAILLLA